MPYSHDMKKRSLYVPDELWIPFKAKCDEKFSQVNGTLLELIAAVNDGRIVLEKPKRPSLKFRLHPTVLQEDVDRWRNEP